MNIDFGLQILIHEIDTKTGLYRPRSDGRLHFLESRENVYHNDTMYRSYLLILAFPRPPEDK